MQSGWEADGAANEAGEGQLLRESVANVAPRASPASVHALVMSSCLSSILPIPSLVSLRFLACVWLPPAAARCSQVALQLRWRTPTASGQSRPLAAKGPDRVSLAERERWWTDRGKEQRTAMQRGHIRTRIDSGEITLIPAPTLGPACVHGVPSSPPCIAGTRPWASWKYPAGSGWRQIAKDTPRWGEEGPWIQPPRTRPCDLRKENKAMAHGIVRVR